MTPVKIDILGKEYLIGCTEEQREGLLHAAEYLSEQMRVIRDAGKIVGTERIAVMAALNITHELLNQSEQDTEFSQSLPERISHLLTHVNDALSPSN